MNYLQLSIKFSNIVNLLLGTMIGFFIMIMIFCAVFSKIIAKSNKNNEIRSISKKSYTDFYMSSYTAKDKIISSLIYEIKEVSRLAHPDKERPVLELSINDVINGIEIIQKKLKKFVNHPLCKDIKHMHIATLLSLEEKVAKPVMQIYSKKHVKILMTCYKAVITSLNLFNPIFYMRKIMTHTIFKQGKKDLIIICLDFVGNTTYEIYSGEKDLQNK